MFPFSPEDLVRLNANEAVAVSSRTPVGTRLPLTPNPDPHAIVYASGNADIQRHRFTNLTGPSTVLTGIRNDTARTLAIRTGRLHSEDSRRLQNLATATALTTGFRLGACLRPAPVAGLTQTASV